MKQRLDGYDYENEPIDWVSVDRHSPCRICQKPDWCSKSRDGKLDLCRRVSNGALKEKEDSNGATYYVHAGPSFEETKASIKSNLSVKRSTLPPNSGAKSLTFQSVEQVELNHLVYSDLLSLCAELNIHERESLLKRGFSEEDLMNYSSTRHLAQAAEKLHQKHGYKLEKVAGFYVNQSAVDGYYLRTEVSKAEGILIPSRDENGKIRCLRIRKNHVRDGENRYIYFSMSHIEGTPKVQLNTHVAGRIYSDAELIFTEGEIKAELIAKHFKTKTLGVPGVGNAKMLLKYIDKKNISNIIFAFDSDQQTNKQVLLPIVKLYGELAKLKINVEILVWNGNSKGADDAIIDGAEFKRLAGQEVTNYLESSCEKIDLEFKSLCAGFGKIGKKDSVDDSEEARIEDIESNWAPELPDLLAQYPSLPEVTKEHLPPLIREFVFGSARRANYPVEYLANSIFSIITSLIGRKLAVKPKKFDRWLVVLVYWAMAIGKPSKKKTPALSAAVKFLEKLEQELIPENNQALANWLAEKQILEHEKLDLLKKVKAEKKDQNAQEARNGIKEKLSEIEVKLSTGKPANKRLLIVDATKERIVEVLKDNPQGVVIVRDELSGLFSVFGAKGREQERSFYLQCFNGDDPYTEERKTRESVYLSGPLLTVLGCVQPGVILKHIHESNGGLQGADGLMARFSGMSYPIGNKYVYVDESPPKGEFDFILNKLRVLRDFNPTDLGYIENHDDLYFIGFTDEAQSIFAKWLTDLEGQIGSETLSEGLEAHLGKYPKAVCSLSLMFHLLDWVCLPQGSQLDPISKNALEMAINWMKIQEAHAKQIYNFVTDKKKASAALLLDKIVEGKINHGDTVRDIYRNEWAGLKKENVFDALKELDAAGILKVITKSNDGTSRDSQIVYLHPELRGQHG